MTLKYKQGRTENFRVLHVVAIYIIFIDYHISVKNAL